MPLLSVKVIFASSRCALSKKTTIFEVNFYNFIILKIFMPKIFVIKAMYLENQTKSLKFRDFW